MPFSWLKLKKVTARSTAKPATNSQASKPAPSRAPISSEPGSRPPPRPKAPPMRGVSPLSSPPSTRNSTPYTVSPISSVRPRNVLDAGQAYNFQNAMSGSMVQYGAHPRESGVVTVDRVSYKYSMDSSERLRLRRMLERKKASGKSGVEIGRFLVETYYNRDKELGRLVTNLVQEQLPYLTISLVVMQSVGLIVTDKEMHPASQRGTGGTGGTGYHSRSTPRSGHHPMPSSHRKPQQRGSAGPAYAAPKPNPLPPLKNGEPGGHVLSRYETSSQFGTPPIRGTANHKYIFEDDDDPPLLRPTTLERIQRGYFDPSIDYGNNRK